FIQKAAKRRGPGENQVGRRFERRNRQEVFVVTGIVGNARSETLDREPPLMAYTPFAQQPLGGMTLVIRTTNAGIAGSIRQIVASIDKTISVSRIRTTQDLLSDAVATPRF